MTRSRRASPRLASPRLASRYSGLDGSRARELSGTTTDGELSGTTNDVIVPGRRFSRNGLRLR